MSVANAALTPAPEPLTTHTVGGPRHLPALDGLRGCAILFVLVTHANNLFGGAFAGSGFTRLAGVVMNAGWVGVDLFFVLSGFLITRILLDARDTSDSATGYFRNFYARRVLRIFPLYYGFLIVCLFSLPRVSAALFKAFDQVSAADRASLLAYFYNFRVALTQRPLANFHIFWSLAIEEHFYLFWPLLVWLLSRRKLMGLCVTIMALSLALRIIVMRYASSLQVAYLITPCRMDGLAAGALVAAATRDPIDCARLVRLARPMLLISALDILLIAILSGHFSDAIDFRFAGHEPTRRDSTLVIGPGITALALFFASFLAILVNATTTGPVRRAMEWPPLRSIGAYSYGMYVFHELLLGVSLILGRKLIPNFEQSSPLIAKPLTAIWLLAFTYTVAWLSYHLFERHFLALKRFFEYRGIRPEARNQNDESMTKPE